MPEVFFSLGATELSGADGEREDLWYPGYQFAARTIETWQANSSTGDTPVAIKVLFPWQLTLFQAPPT